MSLSYLRTYDGAVTERVVEPHGLLCRLNNWYLTGLCTKRQERRVFLLLNIKNLAVLENSFYSMPPGFSLKEAYQDIWGTWTDDESGDLETVRIKVCAGPRSASGTTFFMKARALGSSRTEGSRSPTGWPEHRR
ncbi:MAG: WYL domain-containing protein [Syntrophaceticus schinkii]